MKNLCLIFALLFSGTAVLAQTVNVYKVEPGSNYSRYSNSDLRRRVWELERAVAQLQAQVFQLAMQNQAGSQYNGHPNGGVQIAPSKPWTCQIQSLGKTHFVTAETKSSALAQVLKVCSDASNAVHCSERDVKCGNE